MDSIKQLRTMETGFRRTHMADRYCLSAFSFYGGKIPISVVLIGDETNRLQKQSEPNRAVLAILFLIYPEQALVASLWRNPMKMFWSKRQKHLCKEKELFSIVSKENTRSSSGSRSESMSAEPYGNEDHDSLKWGCVRFVPGRKCK